MTKTLQRLRSPLSHLHGGSHDDGRLDHPQRLIKPRECDRPRWPTEKPVLSATFRCAALRHSERALTTAVSRSSSRVPADARTGELKQREHSGGPVAYRHKGRKDKRALFPNSNAAAAAEEALFVKQIRVLEPLGGDVPFCGSCRPAKMSQDCI